MGFANKGIEHLLKRLKRMKYRGVLGIDIVKDFNTPLEHALEDYLGCMRAVYPYASYIAVNISSPNTPGLRNLQFGTYLGTILKGLKSEQAVLANKYGKTVPLVIKVSPDLTESEVQTLASSFLEHKVDGVVSTNSTISRDGVEDSLYKDQKGGLSGAPLCSQSTRVIKQFHEALGGKIPIIGLGGIMSAQDAQEKLDAGASLVQIYTGLIYTGPELVFDIATQCHEGERSS